ncbi:ribonuclease Ms [Rhizodiscina lignyota]|uniref:ribonuclease T1 n=1 Tax=Rhizodiscina lignyota TaxID=1504668 RepID=A0A9P4MA84_9PEZI|nr:ribonuclease Ms [Rhizodiscina lignyota]
MALPSEIVARQSCVEYCGNTCYWQSDIDAALNKGYSLYQEGETEGSNDYPHAEENYENLPFAVSGPYQEFPILNSFKVYTGGDPGADRVVFNTDGEFAALVTHTGASGDDFVSCSQA